VVGINSQIFSRSGGYMGLSFAIPINEAMRVVGQLKSRGFVERGWLGIQFQDVSQDLARSFGLDKPRGALVAQVIKDSPAEKAGFKTGDVIVAFAGKAITDSRDLPPLVGATAPGEKRTATVVRAGKERTLEVTLGKLENKEVKLSSAEPATSEGSRLNVVVSELTPQQRQQLAIESGVVVREVGPGIAANAGVRAGDVLLQIDGKAIKSAQDLRELSAQLKPGTSVPLLIKRGPAPLFLALQVPPSDKQG
jgi:serine protease Do